MSPTREQCIEIDRSDPLASLRDQFDLPDGTIYLDGNSLGALPRSVADRLGRTVTAEWGRNLVGSWNGAGWIDLPGVVGDKIGRLIGAGPRQTVVADSTSINMFKVLDAAMVHITRDSANPRRVVLSDAANFPTDLYIAESVASMRGFSLCLVHRDDLLANLDESVAIVMLTQVDYRTGHLADMQEVTTAAHNVGAIAVWDLSHSAGALPVDLLAADADFAVGCGYKYLNGGPGAPAFVWAHPRHADRVVQPLAGWMGHEDPFEFSTEYVPASGTARFQSGTPPILSLVALDCGVETLLAADALGGVAALKAKADALTSLFIELVDEFSTRHDMVVITPRDPMQRGSQVSITHPFGGYEVMQALIERGVIGDFRAPDIIRFGFAPLYTRFVDVLGAASQLRSVMETGEWRQPRFHARSRVT